MTEQNNSAILDNSKFIGWLIKVCKIWKERTISYSRASILVRLIKKIYFLPVKTASIILVSVILIKIFFSLIFKQEIGLFAWLIRALFLFIGWGGLFCKANLETIKENSFVLRYVNNACKNN